MQRVLLTLVLSSVLLSGCDKVAQPKASDEIDFGTVENSVYKNKYFGMSITLPESWSVLDQQQRDELTEMGSKMVAGNDANMNKAIKTAAELQSVNLVSAFEHPLGAAVPYNTNLTVVAERVRNAPGIKRGKDYHFHTKKVLQGSQLQVAFEDFYSETVGGKEFDVMPLKMTIGPQTVNQKMYATIDKGYALLFVVSYETAEQEEQLNSILKSVTFSTPTAQ